MGNEYDSRRLRVFIDDEEKLNIPVCIIPCNANGRTLAQIVVLDADHQKGVDLIGIQFDRTSPFV